MKGSYVGLREEQQRRRDEGEPGAMLAALSKHAHVKARGHGTRRDFDTIRV